MEKDLDITKALPPLKEDRPQWSPYAAGFGIGITLILAYWFLGTGLGASGGIARIAAWIWHGVVPRHVEGTAYFGAWFEKGSPPILGYYLVFMALGILAGGALSALGSGRITPMVEKGAGFSTPNRLWFALAGGALVGFASRLARGCTSGQALTGGGMLFTGSVVFLLCMFIGGYVVAILVRRQWS